MSEKDAVDLDALPASERRAGYRAIASSTMKA